MLFWNFNFVAMQTTRSLVPGAKAQVPVANSCAERARSRGSVVRHLNCLGISLDSHQYSALTRGSSIGRVYCMKLLVLAACSLLLLPSAFGGSWYVDNTASGGNSGSSWNDAWESFAAINWRSILPGDTLYISGGSAGQTYQEELVIGAGGVAGSPITISCGVDVGHNGTVILEEANARTIGIRCDQNYIIIDGVHGSAITGNTNYGIRIQNMLQNSGQNGYGIYSQAGPHDIQIFHVEVSVTNNISMDDNASAVWLNGAGNTNITVGWCWVHGPFFSGNNTNKAHFTGLSVFGATTGGGGYTSEQVFSNRVENLWHDGIRVGSNASAWNNDVRFCNGSGHSDSLLAQSGSHVKFYNNFVISSDQCAYVDNVGSTVQVDVWYYNNVLYATNCAAVLDLSPENGDIDTFYFLNNTVIGSSGAYDIRGNAFAGNGHSATNLRLQNNVYISGYGSLCCLGLSSDNTFQDSSSLDYDIFQVPYGAAVANWIDGSIRTLSGLRSLVPARELNGGYGIPSFVNSAGFDFHLSSNDTVATGHGANLSSYFTSDRDGNARSPSGAWDVGAYAAKNRPQRVSLVLIGPPSVVVGGSFELKWSCLGATNLNITGLGGVPLVGSTNLSLTSTTTYQAIALGIGGERSANLTVMVQ